jgi:hypothetical protein
MRPADTRPLQDKLDPDGPDDRNCSISGVAPEQSALARRPTFRGWLLGLKIIVPNVTAHRRGLKRCGPPRDPGLVQVARTATLAARELHQVTRPLLGVNLTVKF